METLDTARLRLRPLAPADAPWVLELLNDPAFLANIGDKNARDLAGARHYLDSGPLAMYAAHGVGLLAVEARASGAPLGICGLIHRPTLEHLDLGYALFPAARGQGIAREACAAVLAWGWRAARRDGAPIDRVLAIVKAENAASIAVLDALGFVSDGFHELTPGDPVRVYALQRPR